MFLFNNKKLFSEYGILDRKDIQYKVLYSKNKRTCDTFTRVNIKREDMCKIKVLLCCCWKESEDYYCDILKRKGFENISIAPYGVNLIDYFLKEKPDVTILKSNIIPYKNSKNTYGVQMLSFLNKINSEAKIILIGTGGLLSGYEKEEAYNLGATCFIKDGVFSNKVIMKDFVAAINQLFKIEPKKQEIKENIKDVQYESNELKNNEEDDFNRNLYDSIDSIDKEIKTIINKLYKLAFATQTTSASGFGKDFSKFIINGAFWGSGDVLRHLLGETNIYQTYTYKIFENYRIGVIEKIEIAKEACSYAINKNNSLEAMRFLLYTFQLKDNLTGTMLTGRYILLYCEKKKIDIPKWFIPYAYKVGILIFLYSNELNKDDYHTFLYDCASVINKYRTDNESIYDWILLSGLSYAKTEKEDEFYKNFIFYYNQYELDRSILNRIKNVWNDYGLFLY